MVIFICFVCRPSKTFGSFDGTEIRSKYELDSNLVWAVGVGVINISGSETDKNIIPSDSNSKLRT